MDGGSASYRTDKLLLVYIVVVVFVLWAIVVVIFRIYDFKYSLKANIRMDYKNGAKKGLRDNIKIELYEIV